MDKYKKGASGDAEMGFEMSNKYILCLLLLSTILRVLPSVSNFKIVTACHIALTNFQLIFTNTVYSRKVQVK